MSDAPEVLIYDHDDEPYVIFGLYDHDDEPYVIFGLNDSDGSESMFALAPEVADEIADRLKAAAVKVRARFPERVQ